MRYIGQQSFADIFIHCLDSLVQQEVKIWIRAASLQKLICDALDKMVVPDNKNSIPFLS